MSLDSRSDLHHQGDIALETQQDSDSSDEDIADTQDTQAAGGERRARAVQG